MSSPQVSSAEGREPEPKDRCQGCVHDGPRCALHDARLCQKHSRYSTRPVIHIAITAPANSGKAQLAVLLERFLQETLHADVACLDIEGALPGVRESTPEQRAQAVEQLQGAIFVVERRGLFPRP